MERGVKWNNFPVLTLVIAKCKEPRTVHTASSPPLVGAHSTASHLLQQRVQWQQLLSSCPTIDSSHLNFANSTFAEHLMLFPVRPPTTPCSHTLTPPAPASQSDWKISASFSTPASTLSQSEQWSHALGIVPLIPNKLVLRAPSSLSASISPHM